MTARETHSSRTKLEATVCEEMTHRGLVHTHRSLHFRIISTDGKAEKYSPAIVAHRGQIVFLVEILPLAAPRTIERLVRFLEQHSLEIVLIIIAAEAMVQKIPPAAYDEIYATSDVAKMIQRIRQQSPSGFVHPFRKVSASGESRNTAN